jgi:hypothetical protein
MSGRKDHTYRKGISMIVTEKWLRANSTSDKVGSWTNAQLAVLGIKPRNKTKGWMDRVIGMYITEEKAIEFEEAKTKLSKITLKIRAKQAKKEQRNVRT